MNQEIKVTSCQECPMHIYEDEYGDLHTCKNGVYKNQWLGSPFIEGTKIHPNCPLKGQSITYKIGEDETSN